MNRWVRKAWFSEDEGASTAEYAVMLVLIICAVISAVNAVGNSTATGWSHNVAQVTSACTGS